MRYMLCAIRYAFYALQELTAHIAVAKASAASSGFGISFKFNKTIAQLQLNLVCIFLLFALILYLKN
jgi:hypothetical protein